MIKSTNLYRRLYNLFENPAVFDLNQILLDGGKEKPMRQFLADVTYASVLDIGCGTGNWVSLAKGSYLGVDQSPTFVSEAKKRHHERPETSFILGDVTEWTSDTRYDIVFLISVLHHLSDEEVAKLLGWTSRFGKQLFVMDLYPVPRNPLSRALYALDRGDFIREPEGQSGLILSTGGYELRKADAFYSVSHLYRHTLFLFDSVRRVG